MLTASGAVPVEALLQAGGRWVVEFHECGLESFALAHPGAARALVPVRVDAPGEAEAWGLLHSARTRVLAATGFTATDHTLRRAHGEAWRRIRRPIAPWSTIRAFWEAVAFERERRRRWEIRGPWLSIGAFRSAIERLAARPDSA